MLWSRYYIMILQSHNHYLKWHRNGNSPLYFTLPWLHNGRDSVSNHQPHDCLLNRPFRRRSKKTSKLRVTGLCAGNSPGTGEFPAQMTSNAENVSIWWRHHDKKNAVRITYYIISCLWAVGPWGHISYGAMCQSSCIKEITRLDIEASGYLGPLLLTWINFNPPCISNHIHYNVRDEITYPFPNFTVHRWILGIHK